MPGKGIIDCAIVATYTHVLPGVAHPAIAVSKADLIAGAQSKHTAVPTNALLQEAVEKGFRNIAVVGLPCHIHAIRKIQQLNTPSRIAKAVTLCIGIFCGSQNYYEGTRHFLAEWFGIENLSDVQSLEYSAGWPESSMVGRRKDGRRLTAPRRDALSLYISLFRRDRCSMCIDFAADLADISIGRYWGEAGTPEDRRRSSFLVRSTNGESLMKQAVQEGAVAVGALDIDGIRASRGYETKRHGSAHRMLRRQEYGWPTPVYHLRPDPSPSAIARAAAHIQAISQDRKGTARMNRHSERNALQLDGERDNESRFCGACRGFPYRLMQSKENCNP
jgi:coenzyme F420 hydrogenase subunit beta